MIHVTDGENKTDSPMDHLESDDEWMDREASTASVASAPTAGDGMNRTSEYPKRGTPEYARMKVRECRQRQKAEDYWVLANMERARRKNRELVYTAQSLGLQLGPFTSFRRPDYPPSLQHKRCGWIKRANATTHEEREARRKKSNADAQSRCHERRQWDRRNNYAEIEYLENLNWDLVSAIAAQKAIIAQRAIIAHKSQDANDASASQSSDDHEEETA